MHDPVVFFLPPDGATVDLGLITPIVTANVRFPPPAWEARAGPDDLAAVAVAADRAGLSFVTCSEHYGVPVSLAAARGTLYWEPAATLGFLAARTERIRLCVYCAVLGYHHPVEIAKRFGTLDVLSGGRVVVGVGVGSLQEEFALLGRDFGDRGACADDTLAALRAALADDVVSHSGPCWTFDDVVVRPSAVQERVPVWVGGRTARSLRRAIALGDGWAPFSLSSTEVAAMLRHGGDTEAWERRARPFAIVPAPGAPLDPAGAPEEVLETIGLWSRAGATGLAVRLRHDSLAECCEQIEALARLADRAGPSPPAAG